MLVNFYDDSVRVEDLCDGLNNGEIVVIETVRPKFNEISHAVKEIITTPPVPLAVEDDEMTWHYYLLPGNTNYSLEDANGIVIRAGKRWEAAGRKWPFTVRV